MSAATNERYPVAIRVLHWFMALAIFGLIASGWYMAGLPDEAPNRYDFYHWHKSFGALALFAVLLRIVLRLLSSIPALPKALKPWEKKASHAAHFGLYALMFAVPATGWIMSATYEGSTGINFFWTTLPGVLPQSQALFDFGYGLHEPLGFSLLALVLIHVAAVIKHRVFDEPAADVLPRMMK